MSLTFGRRGRLAAALFAIALLAYTPGIWWGLPGAEGPGRDHPWGTDELAPVGPINEVYGLLFARHPSFNPQYPILQYVVQLALVGPYYGGLWASGHVSGPAPSFPYGLDEPADHLRTMTLLARLTSLLMAAGVVVLAFRTGELLYNRTLGILAAACVLVQYPMFYYARTSNVDMGALFWTAAGLYVFAGCLVDRLTWRRALALGATAALAASTKDASYAAFVPIAIVVVVRHIRLARHDASVPFWPPLLTAALTTALVYAFASGFVFRPGRYWDHLRFITHGSSQGFYFKNPATLAGYAAVGREVVQCLIDAMGLPMLVCAAGGLFYGTWSLARRVIWMLPALSTVVLIVGPVRFARMRFMMTAAYVLAFFAANLVLKAWTDRRQWVRATGWAAVVGAIGWAAVRGGDLTAQMLRDSRQIASVSLTAVLKPGDRLGHVVPAHNLPRLPEHVTPLLLSTSDIDQLSEASGPEFLVSITLREGEAEVDHERAIPDDVYARLLDGTLGYRLWATFQSPSLFAKRPATYVNPPVRVFVRTDVWTSRGLSGGR